MTTDNATIIDAANQSLGLLADKIGDLYEKLDQYPEPSLLALSVDQSKQQLQLLQQQLATLLNSAANPVSVLITPAASALTSPVVVNAEVVATVSGVQSLGMQRDTGRLLTDREHLEQSIQDIILTPLGSRVMRRDYGCRLFEMIDNTMSPRKVVAIFAAITEAIGKFEPRFSMSRVRIDPDNNSHADGRLGLLLAGTYKGEDVTLGVALL